MHHSYCDLKIDRKEGKMMNKLFYPKALNPRDIKPGSSLILADILNGAYCSVTINSKPYQPEFNLIDDAMYVPATIQIKGNCTNDIDIAFYVIRPNIDLGDFCPTRFLIKSNDLDHLLGWKNTTGINAITRGNLDHSKLETIMEDGITNNDSTAYADFCSNDFYFFTW